MTIEIRTAEGTATITLDTIPVRTAQAIAKQLRDAGVPKAGALGRLVAEALELGGEITIRPGPGPQSR